MWIYKNKSGLHKGRSYTGSNMCKLDLKLKYVWLWMYVLHKQAPYKVFWFQ
jgi:hypothetical protein